MKSLPTQGEGQLGPKLADLLGLCQGPIIDLSDILEVELPETEPMDLLYMSCPLLPNYGPSQ